MKVFVRCFLCRPFLKYERNYGSDNSEKKVNKMDNKKFETQILPNLKDALKKETQKQVLQQQAKGPVFDIIQHVYDALKEKGYNPVNQIVGYILSGDPTYITSYNNARTIMSRLERDELLEEFVNYYIENNL